MISAVHSLLQVNFRRSQREFWKSSSRLQQVQEKILLGYLKKNARTRLGREHHFDRIKNYREFASRIPPRQYEDLEPHIEKIRLGESAVLTAEPVRLLEPTSGSSGGRKLIPYTASLQREYMAAVKPWLADLYDQYPRLKKGSSYWTITPLEQNPLEDSAVPVGFDDDASYFGLLAPLIKRLYPVPQEVKTLGEIENFRYITSLLLLRDRRLSLISLWNPSFFTLLGEYMFRDKDRLISSISKGRLYWPGETPRGKGWNIPADRERAGELQRVLEGGTSLETLWPNLQLISCWCHGASGGLIPGLRRYFPSVAIQPKGLLATEGVLSFPHSGAEDPVLAYRSHFFEFQNRLGEIIPAYQLIKGEVYEPLITTGGGLVRYPMGDRIEVTGSYRGLPTLRFLGRSHTVDLTGEKMSEAFTARVLKKGFGENPPEFALLAPRGENQPRGYCLYYNGGETPHLEDSLEDLLLENYHYAYARKLGQLEKVTVRRVPAKALEQFMEFQRKKGMRLGDIKIPALYPQRDLQDCFGGEEL